MARTRPAALLRHGVTGRNESLGSGLFTPGRCIPEAQNGRVAVQCEEGIRVRSGERAQEQAIRPKCRGGQGHACHLALSERMPSDRIEVSHIAGCR